MFWGVVNLGKGDNIRSGPVITRVAKIRRVSELFLAALRAHFSLASELLSMGLRAFLLI